MSVDRKYESPAERVARALEEEDEEAVLDATVELVKETFEEITDNTEEQGMTDEQRDDFEDVMCAKKPLPIVPLSLRDNIVEEAEDIVNGFEIPTEDKAIAERTYIRMPVDNLDWIMCSGDNVRFSLDSEEYIINTTNWSVNNGIFTVDQ